VFDIAVSTAKAIAKALEISTATGGLPFSAIAAAIGALQIATVLAKPIPAFGEGVERSPEGLALVGEKGLELGIEPSGNTIVYDKPQLTYLKKDTKIIPNKKVAEFIEQSQEFGDGFGFTSKANAFLTSQQALKMVADKHDAKLATVFEMGIESLENAMRKNRPSTLSKQMVKEAFMEALDGRDYKVESYK